MRDRLEVIDARFSQRDNSGRMVAALARVKEP